MVLIYLQSPILCDGSFVLSLDHLLHQRLLLLPGAQMVQYSVLAYWLKYCLSHEHVVGGVLQHAGLSLIALEPESLIHKVAYLFFAVCGHKKEDSMPLC